MKIIDRIADKLGYAPAAAVVKAYRDGEKAGLNLGYARRCRLERERDRALAEAQGFRAQRDTLQGLYDKANRRLEAAGMISVTTFV